jgi:hypothetical protein
MERAQQWNSRLLQMQTDSARLAASALHTQMSAARTVLMSQLSRFRRTGDTALLDRALRQYREAQSRWEQQESHVIVLIREEMLAATHRADPRAMAPEDPTTRFPARRVAPIAVTDGNPGEG